MRKRVCVITSGHLSTCPRMLKAADALDEAGYEVRMISTSYVPWATITDVDVRKNRSWKWSVIDYDRHSARLNYVRTGIRQRAARIASRVIGSSRCPLPIAVRAHSRMHSELLREAITERADLYYGGTTGALASAAMAARRMGVPYVLDLEDFHSAEQAKTSSNELAHGLAERIEKDLLRDAAFLTAASAPIAKAYEEKYGVCPIRVSNTFPLPANDPDLEPSPGEGLRLYWFSQTIGPRRGLEDAIIAMGLANIPGELHLRGNPIPGYLESLRLLAQRTAPLLRVILHEPVSPDSMVNSCSGYDVGLATEQSFSFNNGISTSNKAFTYMLAGVAIAFTDTPGQRQLAMELGNGAVLYQVGDVEALAGGLKKWAHNKELLRLAKTAAWQAAKRRWHWEHVEERGALLESVAKVLSN